MNVRILTEQQILDFYLHLKTEEKSENTCEKYVRDIKAFYISVFNKITKSHVCLKFKLTCDLFI